MRFSVAMSQISAVPLERPSARRLPSAEKAPSLIEAARATCSEGEIVQALQEVWGDYRELPAF